MSDYGFRHVLRERALAHHLGGYVQVIQVTAAAAEIDDEGDDVDNLRSPRCMRLLLRGALEDLAAFETALKEFKVGVASRLYRAHTIYVAPQLMSHLLPGKRMV